jgi:beta-lactamase superfamily II metal-dependent hydrolase
MSEASPSSGGSLTFQFLDVGQGDGIYIEFPNGKNMLVDLGSTANKDLVRGDILTYFASLPRFQGSSSTLDYLVLTHGDQDHYNMVLPFLLRFNVQVDNLIYGGDDSHYTFTTKKIKDFGEIKKRVRNTLRCQGAGPHPLGRPADFGEVQILIHAINAPCVNKAKAWQHNTPSVVMQLLYAERSVILSGDATIDTESYILAFWEEALKASESPDSGGELPDDDSGEEMDTGEDLAGDHPLSSIVLKVGHHGSLRTSIRPEWIEAIAPAYVIISSDRSGWTGTPVESREEGRPKYKLTHHRLPQQICIDVIADNTDLADDCEPHTYVAAYNPDDYSDKQYTQLRTQYPEGFDDPHKGKLTIGWQQVTTREGLFTTLTAMDVRDEEGAFDRGSQYQLSIHADGSLQILSSYDYMQHSAPVAADTAKT